VGSLSVPDPRATNPELFDLRNPDAPIPQFVNAMKMAGIEITAEQVVQGITYEALKDTEGNLFVVAVCNLDIIKPYQSNRPGMKVVLSFPNEFLTTVNRLVREEHRRRSEPVREALRIYARPGVNPP
jgi:hypothetical protein